MSCKNLLSRLGGGIARSFRAGAHVELAGIAILLVMPVVVGSLAAVLGDFSGRHGTPVPGMPFWFSNGLLALHISGGLPALILGPLTLYAPFRNKNPRLHRRMGTVYVFSCLLGAVSVFPLVFFNRAGMIGLVGFGSMALIWFWTTWLAYRAVKNKDYVAHRRWMIRSYAITFAFVHVNLTYRLLLPYRLFSIQGIQAFQSCVSWQINLLLAEIYLAATSHAGKFVEWARFRENLRLFYSPQDKIYFR